MIGIWFCLVEGVKALYGGYFLGFFRVMFRVRGVGLVCFGSGCTASDPPPVLLLLDPTVLL